MEAINETITWEANEYANDKQRIEKAIHSINNPEQLETIKNLITLFNRKYGRSAHNDANFLRGYAAGFVNCLIEHNVRS